MTPKTMVMCVRPLRTCVSIDTDRSKAFGRNEQTGYGAGISTAGEARGPFPCNPPIPRFMPLSGAKRPPDEAPSAPGFRRFNSFPITPNAANRQRPRLVRIAPFLHRFCTEIEIALCRLRVRRYACYHLRLNGLHHCTAPKAVQFPAGTKGGCGVPPQS